MTTSPPAPRAAASGTPSIRAQGLPGLARLVLRTPFTRRAWAELAYAVAALPLAVIVFPPTLMLLFAGGALSVTVVGLGFLMLLTLFARGTGAVRRALVRALLGVTVPAPPPPVRRDGLTGRIRARIGDAGGWRSVAYTVVALPLSFLMAFGAALSWFNGVVLTVYPALWQIGRAGRSSGERSGTFVRVGGLTPESAPQALLLTVMGVALLLAAPWITRALVSCDRWLVTSLLGPTRSQRRIRDLEDTRARAVEDAAAKLRRIERDLHDGAQARIVAVAMTLSMAREKLDDEGGEPDVDRARDLVDNALGNAREAIGELRDLARGIHPPVLDQGLDTALATLAACGPLPVDLETDLGTDPARRPPAPIEAIAYFCVAELLTNAARHGGATRAEVTAEARDGVLRVVVADDGRGGARPGRGSGLSGLADRVGAVDGSIVVDSPPGGPTVVTVTLPLGPVA